MLIFSRTYVLLAIGRLPGFRMDRTDAAIIGHVADRTKVRLVLAMSSTLAGNLTILGSVANLMVIQRARREAEISFWTYFKTARL